MSIPIRSLASTPRIIPIQRAVGSTFWMWKIIWGHRDVRCGEHEDFPLNFSRSTAVNTLASSSKRFLMLKNPRVRSGSILQRKILQERFPSLLKDLQHLVVQAYPCLTGSSTSPVPHITHPAPSSGCAADVPSSQTEPVVPNVARQIAFTCTMSNGQDSNSSVGASEFLS